jgi:leucyl-tRNA synthetase
MDNKYINKQGILQTMDQDQQEIEIKWQKYWKDSKVFEPKISDKEKCFVTVPYPYANSALHIGHGRTFTMADVIARYNRVLGKNVLYPCGFHISGTPVLAVADAVKNNDPKQVKLTKEAIAEYVSDPTEQEALLKSFVDPFNIAEFFSTKIEETFDTIGLSIDWSRQFTTGDPGYHKFVQWQFRKLKDLGILVQGKYPILYSPIDDNAVGEDDIKDGDTEKVSVQEMKYIKFKRTDANEYLVAATLRPDSLFGATNLYVKHDMALVKLRVGSDIWIVSKASQIKIENQFDSVSLISEHTGQEFIDKEVIVPILNKAVPVYPMDYPDENHGTGVVYSSPADSPHDYMYLFELKFPGEKLSAYSEDPLKLTQITKTKDKKGNEIMYKSGIPAFDKLHKFGIFEVAGNYDKLEQAKEELYKEAYYGAVMINCGEFDGISLKGNKGAMAVNAALEEQSLGGLFYETSRRAVTRAGTPVIVANLDGQWFLDYSADETKQKAFTLLDEMTFLPESLKKTQQGYLEWVQKRPCARKRGIGTPLPGAEDWVVEPLSDSTIYQMYYLFAQHLTSGGLQVDDLTDDFFNYIFSMADLTAPSEIATKIKSEVDYWQSFDIRYTAPPHMSNHLSFLIYHYALMFPKKLQPKNITIGGLMIKDGSKISKSKGNGIPLIQVREKYGVDVYRLYCAGAASFDAQMDFRDEDVAQLERKFAVWKQYMFDARAVTPKSDLGGADNWLISKFYSRAKEYFVSMKDLKVREAYIQILYEFLNDITYHERRTSTENTISVLAHIYKEYVTLMTPVVPHIAEEILEGAASFSAFTADCDYKIDKNAEDIENIAQNLISNIAQLKAKKNMTDLHTITLVQATEHKFKLFDALKTKLSETREFKVIMQSLMSEFGSDSKFIQKFVPKTLSDGLDAYLSKTDEVKYLESIKTFLETEFDCSVIIVSEDSHERAVAAIPGRPVVVLDWSLCSSKQA